jgi:hypothetical protein
VFGLMITVLWHEISVEFGSYYLGQSRIHCGTFNRRGRRRGVGESGAGVTGLVGLRMALRLYLLVGCNLSLPVIKIDSFCALSNSNPLLQSNLTIQPTKSRKRLSQHPNGK